MTSRLDGPPPIPKAIIFDWDNTLVDTFPVIRDALNTTLTAFGKEPWTIEEVHQRVAKSVRDRFPTLFGDDWEDARDVFYNRYDEIHKIKLEPMAGAAELLTRLAQTDIYLALVSNKRGDFLRSEAEYMGWDGHFGAMVGANDAARDKPAPDPVTMAAQPGGISLGPAVWFAGDANIDLECADNSGCTGILVGRGNSEITYPHHHFADCMALCKFIDKL